MTTMDRRRVLRGVAAGGAALATAAVTGPAGRAALANPAAQATDAFSADVDEGLTYFRECAAEQATLAEALRDAIADGNLDAARAAYVRARPPYEEIEVLAASFPETDGAIDARPYAVDGGETNPNFVGFHRIEALLYRDGDLAAALPFAETLVDSVETLRADLDRRDAFSAQLHFEGMIALATEVAAKKISSEEETWSDQSLLIFTYNWRGIRSQFAPFVPALDRVDPAVARDAGTAFAAALATLDAFPESPDGGLASYRDIGPEDRGRMVRASYDLRDALIRARDALDLG